MDSGNSSSDGGMQSSGGDDEEEYESRTESVPPFLNSNPISNPHPSLVSQHQNHPPSFFDPSTANFLNPLSQSQPNNSLLNLDGVGPLSQISEPNCTDDFGNLQGSSSSQQGLISTQGLYPSSSSRPSTKSDQRSVVKNPKKRTRASRTAPTTILTADPMNFRAIVQEFTGFPAPPFSGSSYSRRLDLFGSSSGMRSCHLETLGSLYPLPPSGKRVKPTPIVSSSSPSFSVHPLADANIYNTSSNNAIPTCSNYDQMEADLGILKQPQNILNMQNFQSFLHPLPLHPCLNLPGFVVGSLDELGSGHGNATAEGLNDGNQDHFRPSDWYYDSSDQN